jgi:hypothetical protein
MVSLGIDSVQTLTLPRGGAPTSKPVPATTPGSGVSTNFDKGKAAAEPAENARDTSGAGGSVTDVEEPTIPTHPDDDFGLGTCVEGESSGRGCRVQEGQNMPRSIPQPIPATTPEEIEHAKTDRHTKIHVNGQ